MFRALHRHVVRKRLAKRMAAFIAPFDKEIADARAKHKPIAPIVARKEAFVRRALAGAGR